MYVYSFVSLHVCIVVGIGVLPVGRVCVWVLYCHTDLSSVWFMSSSSCASPTCPLGIRDIPY